MMKLKRFLDRHHYLNNSIKIIQKQVITSLKLMNAALLAHDLCCWKYSRVKRPLKLPT